MKKLIIILTAIILCSCKFNHGEPVVIKVEKSTDCNHYRYHITTNHFDFYSDKAYQIGDILK